LFGKPNGCKCSVCAINDETSTYTYRAMKFSFKKEKMITKIVIAHFKGSISSINMNIP
jgi:hypothetical protein